MQPRRQGTALIIYGACIDKEHFRASVEGEGFSLGRLTFQGSPSRSERSVATTRQPMRDSFWPS